MEIVLDDKFCQIFWKRYFQQGDTSFRWYHYCYIRAGGSIDSARRISGDAMKTMNALLKLQEKNLLKYVIFILLTTLLNHDYAIRHVFLSWMDMFSSTDSAKNAVDMFPQTAQTRKRLWICSRKQKNSKDIQPIVSSHIENVALLIKETLNS